MPTIIIEGFDNTGKTTLAKRLADLLGYNYVSGGGPEVGNYDGALQRLKTGMPNKVQDRTWISEVIYGTIIRKRSGISDQDMMKMIEFHKENKIFLIYARPPKNVILESLTDRDQMAGVAEYAEELLAMYNYYMMEKLPIYLGPPMMYDYTTTKVEDLIQAMGYLHIISGREAIDAKRNYLNENNITGFGPSLTDN